MHICMALSICCIDLIRRGQLHFAVFPEACLILTRRELELRATKQTKWSRLKLAPDGPLWAQFKPRSICTLENVVDLPEDALYDYCGIVVGCSCNAPGESVVCQA